MKFQDFETFESNMVIESINEGFFDKLINLFASISKLFSDPEEVDKKVKNCIDNEEHKFIKFDPVSLKTGETQILSMRSEEDKRKRFSLALTKLANLPDKSVLFQISATSSKEMLKVLVNSENEKDLAKYSVMAIISSNGVEKDKPLRMRLLKSITKNGDDYVSTTVVHGVVNMKDLEKNGDDSKKTKESKLKSKF